MGYPSNIVSWDNVATAGRVLVANDISQPITELEGIEAELGVNVHGEAGSLSERLSIALSESGVLFGRVAMADVADAQIKRMRCGYKEVTTLSGGTQFEEFVALLSFDQPFKNTPLMFFCIHDLSTTTGRPAYATWGASVSTAAANVYTQPLEGKTTTAGVTFGLSWVAIESVFDSVNTGL